MKANTQLKQWIQAQGDIFVDLVRIYLGIGLFIKSIWFMTHQDYLNQLIAKAENLVFVQAAVAHYVIPVHLVGGLLLAVGLLTRVAALAQIPILAGAIFYVYLPQVMFVEPRQSLEFSALVLFLLILILIHGGGRWSVDYLLSKKSLSESAAAPAT